MTCTVLKLPDNLYHTSQPPLLPQHNIGNCISQATATDMLSFSATSFIISCCKVLDYAMKEITTPFYHYVIRTIYANQDILKKDNRLRTSGEIISLLQEVRKKLEDMKKMLTPVNTEPEQFKDLSSQNKQGQA